MAFVPVYILILGFTIIVDYIAGIKIEKAEGKYRKALLIISLIANIGVLAIFKYYNFFNDNTGRHLPYLSILLPIGLSFHTLQAMSYTIEVYRGRQNAERHFGIYALYVMFYPQLVAGPIEHPQNLLHQFYEKHEFEYDRVTSGLKQMVWGMFKKVVIADRLALITDPVFNNPYEYNGLTLIIATVFFSFQIYCDFSGYSDIAIGAARVMGFRLMKNFDRPFSAKTVSEFWTRWHISLSTWFRDYLYIPLGGKRVGVIHWYINLLIVFLVSGLWHGAAWNFLIWGGLQGAYVIFGNLTRNIRERIKKALGIKGRLNTYLQIVITFALFAVSMVFFRAHSLSDAFYILRKMSEVFQQINLGEFSKWSILFSGLLIVLMQIFEHWQKRIIPFLNELSTARRWLFYYIIVFAIIYLGVFENRQFIYFQF